MRDTTHLLIEWGLNPPPRPSSCVGSVVARLCRALVGFLREPSPGRPTVGVAQELRGSKGNRLLPGPGRCLSTQAITHKKTSRHLEVVAVGVVMSRDTLLSSERQLLTQIATALGAPQREGANARSLARPRGLPPFAGPVPTLPRHVPSTCRLTSCRLHRRERVQSSSDFASSPSRADHAGARADRGGCSPAPVGWLGWKNSATTVAISATIATVASLRFRRVSSTLVRSQRRNHHRRNKIAATTIH